MFSSHVDDVAIHRRHQANGTLIISANICFTLIFDLCSRQSLVWLVWMMYWLSDRTLRAWVNDKSFLKWCCFNYFLAVSQANNVATSTTAPFSRFPADLFHLCDRKWEASSIWIEIVCSVIFFVSASNHQTNFTFS